jgi:hypothetical protein
MVSDAETDCTFLITTEQNNLILNPQKAAGLAVSSLMPLNVSTHNEVHQGARVIYTIDVYAVDPLDTSAFTAAFDDGPWQRLFWQEHGHLHTGLHVRSTLPTTYLSLGIWRSEAHYLKAEATPEFREFHRSLKLLSTSYECIGALRYECQLQGAEIPTYPLQIPVHSSVPRRTRGALPKAS